MSNKHKLRFVIPIVTLFLALFACTPLASAAICSDANQTKIPDGMSDLTQIASFCSQKGGKPLLYQRNNTQKCLDGSTLSEAAKKTKTDLGKEGASQEEIRESVAQVCVEEGHVGYDPDGRRLCDDGLNLDKVSRLSGPESNATIEQIDEWCSENGHVGYSYTPPTTTSGAEDTEAQDCTDASVADNIECNQIVVWLKKGINFLSAGVLIIVIVMIIIAGIQYSYAGGDPNGVAEAKKKITNAVLALFAYLFLYAFIQYLIPGGVL